MASSKKLTWLLLLQAWAMLWVVIGHAPLTEPTDNVEFDTIAYTLSNWLFSFAYSFHMPLFIMISGYLFYRTRIARNWNYVEMIKEKWLRLGIPYITFITAAIIVKICLPGVNRAVDISPIGLISNYLNPFNGALQEMWFVATIFIYFTIYPIYPLILKSNVTLLFSIIIAILLHYIPTDLLPEIFAINRAAHFFIYFLIGITISCRQLETVIVNLRTIIISIIGFIIALFFNENLLTSIFASITFWGLSIIIDSSLSNNLFHSFRNYTYQIFLIGIFAQIGIKFLYGKLYYPGSYAAWWLLCIIVGIYVPVLIAKIAEKSRFMWLKRIFGL